MNDGMLSRNRKLAPKAQIPANELPPASIELQGKTLNLWTYPQLNGLNAARLRNRARDLRDCLGAKICGSPPSNPLDIVDWIINWQVEIMVTIMQVECSPAHFSVPSHMLADWAGLGAGGNFNDSKQSSKSLDRAPQSGPSTMESWTNRDVVAGIRQKNLGTTNLLSWDTSHH